MKLGSLAWPQLRVPGRLLILPLGATEQHGPHLPIETDTLIARALADAVGDERPDVIVAPVLPYGSSGEHAGFPGTLSLGQAALELAIVELIRSADHFAAVVVFSWHGGNAEALQRAVERLSAEGRRASVWRPCIEGDLHAGCIETSLMLALAPELVGDLRPVEATEPLDVLLPSLKAAGVQSVSRTGVLGDATAATAQQGHLLFARLVADLARFVDATVRAPAVT